MCNTTVLNARRLFGPDTVQIRRTLVRKLHDRGCTRDFVKIGEDSESFDGPRIGSYQPEQQTQAKAGFYVGGR